ncbi:hypothetical protein ACWEKR_31110 [Nocardia sp. NPDC004573]
MAAATAESLPVPEWSDTGQEQSLIAAFEILDSRRKIYEACAASAANRLRAIEAREQEVIDAKQNLSLERETLAAAAEDVERTQQQLRDAKATLALREAEIRASEAEAKAGFVAIGETARTELEKELAERRERADAEIIAERRRTAEHIEELERDAQRRRADLMAEIRAAEERVRLRDIELAEREQRIRRDWRALREQSMELDEREQAIASQTRSTLAAESAETERIRHLSQIEVESAQLHIKELTERLRKAQEALMSLGSNPTAILDELARLREQNAALQDKLAARLSDDDVEKLRFLERSVQEISAERERLSYECQRLKGNVLANEINLLKVRQLEDAEHEFHVISRGYEARIAELQATIEQVYNDRPDPGTPLFPRCVGMDDDPQLTESGVLLHEPVDLSKLTRSLQATMFRESKRAYRISDIAVFLGGMAMSRLHLLEGMSGIGKTSLPKAFAAAMHTDCAVIEVQAGWRDRSDLFGHLNTFEKRFEESDFLQALYRAQTPRYRGRPYFVVLDEMNLSRPEQYFSVILSKLQNDDGKPINLVGAPAGREPALLVDGIGIRLPDNVWFVGTANQDESTLEFADKTYNRAHLMELPAHRPQVVDRRDSVQPLSLRSLQSAFDNAEQEHSSAVALLTDLIGNLADDLWQIGRLQVSPRVEDQLRKFVPVVISAANGASPNEQHDYGDADQDGRSLAADHFLAYKVLRSIRGRFDVTADRIERLRESLILHWGSSDLVGAPIRCLRMFDEERRRREG